MKTDVTSQVDFSNDCIDGEQLPLTKCVCGRGFPLWDFTISIYPDTASECPSCKRKLIFSTKITVYEIGHVATSTT